MQEFSFEQWYPRFAKHTFASRVIPLPANFIAYLKRDGIILPRPPPQYSQQTLSHRDPRRGKKKPAKRYDDSSSSSDSDEEGEDEYEECFAEVEMEIMAKTEELGGEVFPKLNWTCPRDASWMCGGSLDCATAGEIFLLLKSSDFIQGDLEQLEKMQQQPVLVLRKWVKKWNPSMEFRCIVRARELLYVCQRDAAEFFPFLTEAAMQQELLNRITQFARENILPEFPADASYVFDVYLTPKRVYLVDFGPLKPDSDPHALLTWQDLVQPALPGTSTFPKLLVVANKNSRNFAEQRAMAMHRVPMDLVEGNMDPDFFKS